ncbi:MAG: HNH endonuclease [Halanaerobiales bacterium]|nr:HNH endonuclease [Halanaerobiales bacterium]
MKNKTLKAHLILQYGKIDIFGYKPTKKYKLTLHHITPLRENGKTTEENCCIFRGDIHVLYNEITVSDKENGKYIDDYVRKVKVLV